MSNCTTQNDTQCQDRITDTGNCSTAIQFDVGVVLPCAGSGLRLGDKTPKQYCKIMGRPLFSYALEEFLCIPWIKKIALVVDNPQYVRSTTQALEITDKKLMIVQGMSSRHGSIKAGVKALERAGVGVEVVVVHDAVRPFVPLALLAEVVLAAHQHGAAGPTRPLVSTVVRADAQGFLQASLDRAQYLASETPQAFRAEVLGLAYSKCSDMELECGTECLQLALAHAGVRARLIPGPTDLWKVTYRRDLLTATACLRERRARLCVSATELNEMARHLISSLSPHTTVQFVPAAQLPSLQPTQPFLSVVALHEQRWSPSLFDLAPATLLGPGTQGLVLHVLQTESEDAEEHQLPEAASRHCALLRCSPACEPQRLAGLVVALTTAPWPGAFAQQTFRL